MQTMQVAILVNFCLVLACALPSQQLRETIDSSSKSVVNSTRSSASAGTYGLDVSASVSQSDFECLINAGYDYAIIRAFRSNGQPDYNAAVNIAHARAAGMSHIHVYMFPCPKCGSPSQQLKNMVSALGTSDYGAIWLDVEDSGLWLGSPSENQAFFEELLSTARGYKNTGVYTSATQWGPIMGNGYTGGSSAPLWYSEWDGNPSFVGFTPFGGWSQPAIKQYAQNVAVCGVEIDQNWY